MATGEAHAVEKMRNRAATIRRRMMFVVEEPAWTESELDMVFFGYQTIDHSGMMATQD